jgi:endonuclease/exonuclease/phosphatase (EEP) superfamily protein YafD
MRVARALVGGFGLVLLAICLLLTLDRIVVPDGRAGVVAMAFVSYALPGYVVCLLAALWLRMRPSSVRARRGWTGVTVVAFLGAALHAGWQAPSYVGDHPSQEPTLTVLQLNTRFGEADPAEVVRLAATRHADVVVLEELDTGAAARLARAGLHTLLPHSAGRAAAGTMVFSRWPVAHARELPVSKGGVLVQVRAPRPFWLVGLHASQPALDVSRWSRDLADARRVVAGRRGAGLVVGDFNATLAHGPLRAILATGLRDAAEEANSGRQPTWPSSQVRFLGLPVPVSLFAIDHVLVSRQFGVVSTRTITVTGTDHKALVASLVR